jgi:4-hydroxy-3-polyprenylbenzoate decarboxylase
LLLAIGSERYTPYAPTARPAELLTIANHILGTGQLSLAKFLFITAGTPAYVHTRNISQFFQYMLERIDWERDLHFYTQTTIDTLDYSGTDLNSGSKLVIAAYGSEKRKLATDVPEWLTRCKGLQAAKLVMPGVVAFQTDPYTDESTTQQWMDHATQVWLQQEQPNTEIPLLIWCNDAGFTAQTLRNFCWVAFTRCNPSHDVHGIDAFVRHKHYGCRGPLVIDARIKPHHAPAVEMDPLIEKRIEKLFAKGGSLNKLYS